MAGRDGELVGFVDARRDQVGDEDHADPTGDVEHPRGGGAVARVVAEEQGQADRHRGAADPAGGATPDRGAVVGEDQADGDEQQAGARRLEVGGQPEDADHQAGQGGEGERRGGSVVPPPVDPASHQQEHGSEDQRDDADGGGVGRVVADLLEPARAGDDATSAVDDLARRRIDEIAGGLERLGPAGAEEPRPKGSNGNSNRFSVSSSTVNHSAMSPDPRKNGRPLPGPIRYVPSHTAVDTMRMPSVLYGGNPFSSKVRKNMNAGTPRAAATAPAVATGPRRTAASTK